MIQTICCECGASGRFDQAETAIAGGWQRLRLSGGRAPLLVEGVDWLCPREARETITARLEARVAEGLEVQYEGRILES